ncbi:hypothetical protein GCM10010169_23330 [Micromonospora fulviviridis]|uniref:excisionase family DNA-binding protein n=1 Tax=Micromonospora fulviviridis TaxID=47860 RepID=UPI0019A4E8AB|nr:helix-turn-helix domain-containing protein [Micromonospora fulviviridis]GGR78484.1 hypothetical protein GCM10010169_23330 [Micromonospora fulviviridis]
MRTPLLLTVEEAARELGIGRSRMFELIGSGAVDSVKVGRSRRIPTAALGEYVDRLRVEQRQEVA